MSSDPEARVLLGAALARELEPADPEERERALDAALRYGRRTELRAGKAFFYQGDKAEAAYLLVEGRARTLQYRMSGKPIELAPRGLGDWLGLPALALGAPHAYDALADSSCVALAFTRYAFSLASARPAFSALAARALAREVLALHAYIEDESPEERIVGFLLARRKEIGGLCNARVSVTQEGIARAIGVTRETVNKRLAVLEGQGLVRTLRGQIEVLDWEGLAARRDQL
jgi:CRP/FNR family transcriptional regulator